MSIKAACEGEISWLYFDKRIFISPSVFSKRWLLDENLSFYEFFANLVPFLDILVTHIVFVSYVLLSDKFLYIFLLIYWLFLWETDCLIGALWRMKYFKRYEGGFLGEFTTPWVLVDWRFFTVAIFLLAEVYGVN